jgi:hypothetical protein
MGWAWSNDAVADPALPGLTNLNFATYGGADPKNCFTCVNPTGWTGGNGLIYIDSPTAGADAISGNGGIATYGNPSVISGLGAYNYVEADGNPHFESGFNYETVMGLTAGTTYSLSFYQAASQEVGFSGPTTNQWIVALGAPGSSLFSASGTTPTTPDQNCGTNCVYTDTDPSASIAASMLMNVPSNGLVDWNFTTVELTASAATETLSFLAWGDNGNTTNLPPMAFLTGVNSPAGLVPTPEPASIALFGVGLAGVGGVVRRRRKNRSAAD